MANPSVVYIDSARSATSGRRVIINSGGSFVNGKPISDSFAAMIEPLGAGRPAPSGSPRDIQSRLDVWSRQAIYCSPPREWPDFKTFVGRR